MRYRLISTYLDSNIVLIAERYTAAVKFVCADDAEHLEYVARKFA